MWEAGPEVKPKYLGDDMVLLVGLNDTRAEELCNAEEDKGISLFHSLEKWNPGLQIGYRLVWILCWGVPCVGRKYTWYRPNGKAKSRLDRFLVSADWFNKCQDNCQFILQRNFSDHCPILLRSSNVVWGPKPFRVLDCWF